MLTADLRCVGNLCWLVYHKLWAACDKPMDHMMKVKGHGGVMLARPPNYGWE